MNLEVHLKGKTMTWQLEEPPDMYNPSMPHFHYKKGCFSPECFTK